MTWRFFLLVPLTHDISRDRLIPWKNVSTNVKIVTGNKLGHIFYSSLLGELGELMGSDEFHVSTIKKMTNNR